MFLVVGAIVVVVVRIVFVMLVMRLRCVVLGTIVVVVFLVMLLVLGARDVDGFKVVPSALLLVGAVESVFCSRSTYSGRLA